MVRRSRSLLALLTGSLLATSVTLAAAHCCHDERDLGIQEQSGLRPGLHGMGSGLGDDSDQAPPPSIGNGLGSSNTNTLGSGGLGEMHGNSIGNYGGGSIGERGPGGLGALHGNSITTQPPRPR